MDTIGYLKETDKKQLRNMQDEEDFKRILSAYSFKGRKKGCKANKDDFRRAI